MARPSPRPPASDALAATDRQLEARLNVLRRLLAADPSIVDHTSLVWVVGYLLSQRARYAIVMAGAAQELEELGSDRAELIALLKDYAALDGEP